MVSIDHQGGGADRSGAEQGGGKFDLKQVLLQPLGVEQGVGGVVQGDAELQRRALRDGGLQADLDLGLALTDLPWEQPPGSFFRLIFPAQQVDHLKGSRDTLMHPCNIHKEK